MLAIGKKLRVKTEITTAFIHVYYGAWFLFYLHSFCALVGIMSLNPRTHDLTRCLAIETDAIGCHNWRNVIRRHFNRNINSSSREGGRTRQDSKGCNRHFVVVVNRLLRPIGRPIRSEIATFPDDWLYFARYRCSVIVIFFIVQSNGPL